MTSLPFSVSFVISQCRYLIILHMSTHRLLMSLSFSLRSLRGAGGRGGEGPHRGGVGWAGRAERRRASTGGDRKLYTFPSYFGKQVVQWRPVTPKDRLTGGFFNNSTMS
jgi:hypothetical protein